jgi:hypothetical protein
LISATGMVNLAETQFGDTWLLLSQQLYWSVETIVSCAS